MHPSAFHFNKKNQEKSENFGRYFVANDYFLFPRISQICVDYIH